MAMRLSAPITWADGNPSNILNELEEMFMIYAPLHKVWVAIERIKFHIQAFEMRMAAFTHYIG